MASTHDDHHHHQQHFLLIFISLLQLISVTAEVKHVFQKIDLMAQLVKPVKDKVERFNDFLAVLYHPNFGGVGLLKPAEYFWEKLKEKKEQLLPSAHIAVFGGGKGEHHLHDYPSAYRRGETLINV